MSSKMFWWFVIENWNFGRNWRGVEKFSEVFG